jgi:hypothetical protein
VQPLRSPAEVELLREDHEGAQEPCIEAHARSL